MKRAGFTLLEVLVALAIVTLGMATLMSALATSANTSVYLRDRTLAQWVALNRLAELRLAAQQPHTGTSESEVDFAGRKWHYRQEVLATQGPGLVRIDLKVRPADTKANGDSGWFVTVSGISGDAVAAPRGDNPMYGSGMLAPGSQAQLPQSSFGSVRPGTLSPPGTDSSGTAPSDPGDALLPATPDNQSVQP